MVSKENAEIVLLSIHPKYVRSIISGEKKVEFRRQKFSKPVNLIVIYGTRPIQKVVAYFRVSHITQASPHELWDRYQTVAGIGKKSFLDYFKGAKDAVAIVIDSVKILPRPVGLYQISKNLNPPQSFTYLSGTLFDKLCDYF